ncbi:mobilization protein [Bifidobacterium tsurumiense]|uniref:Mobilization protein n=2 Tax=Bifidobacterium tsurumiense TaxID=356829 RepID=A0A087EJV0_9BIFI|nr:mobilization protein [Bifidobacterium tsurumiense]
MGSSSAWLISKILAAQLSNAKRNLETVRERMREMPPDEVRQVREIIRPVHDKALDAENANLFTRGRLRRAAEKTAVERSALLKQAAPWLEDTRIPVTYGEVNTFSANADKTTMVHVLMPYERRIAELETRLAKAKESEAGNVRRGTEPEHNPVKNRKDFKAAFNVTLNKNLEKANTDPERKTPQTRR